jgi:hypothetical protein
LAVNEKDNLISTLQTELADIKRYTQHIEVRYKEVSDSEDAANRKVLTLLTEV